MYISYDNGQLNTFQHTCGDQYLSVPMHLNWKGMFHDSSLFGVPNTEAVDELRDNLLPDAVHATQNISCTGLTSVSATLCLDQMATAQ